MSRKLTQEEFITRARTVHGDKYDYSKVEYKGAKDKVCIICPEHGEFWQRPNDHLSGYECHKCGYEKTYLKQTKTVEQFIKEAKTVHGDKYDYSKVNYLGAHTKVCIICPEHGEFWQRPNDHLNGQGCPKCFGCGPSKGEQQIMDYLDKISEPYVFQKRFDTCRSKNPLPFDFYLPNRNLCIEFQGEQHFRPVDKFDGVEGFKERQLDDSIKKEWCLKEENPNLLEILYNEDVIEKLNNTLSH